MQNYMNIFDKIKPMHVFFIHQFKKKNTSFINQFGELGKTALNIPNIIACTSKIHLVNCIGVYLIFLRFDRGSFDSVCFFELLGFVEYGLNLLECLTRCLRYKLVDEHYTEHRDACE